VLLALVYLALTIAILWPSLRAPYSLVAAGASKVAAVPLFNAWTMWWNAGLFERGIASYWDAPIFWPNEGTFAFSEPQPATLIVAPIIWLTDSRILAYNIYLTLSLVLNGLFAAALLRTLRIGRWFAAVGGAAVLMLPLVHEQVDVVQLVPLWTVLWALDSILRMKRDPSILRGVSGGVAVGLTFWTSVHHALFLCVLLLLTVPLFPVRWKRKATWIAAGAGLVPLAMLSLPLILPIHSILNQYEFERSDHLVERLSAKPEQYLSSAGSGLIPGGLRSLPGHRRRLPGWLSCAAALTAVFVCGRRRRRATVFLVAFAAIAVLLALGTNLRIGDWQPWWTMSEWIPGLAQVRNVYRFGYFFQLAVVLLAFVGLWRLFLFGRCRSRRIRKIWCGVVTMFAVAAALELYPPGFVVVGTPSVSSNRGWIDTVARELPAGKSVLYLPYVPGRRVADFDFTTRMMLLGTWHGAPSVNGYSGFFPSSHFELQDLLEDDFPTQAALDHLALNGVGLVVALTSLYPPDQMLVTTESQWRLSPVSRHASGFDVYRLERIQNPPAAKSHSAE